MNWRISTLCGMVVPSFPATYALYKQGKEWENSDIKTPGPHLGYYQIDTHRIFASNLEL